MSDTPLTPAQTANQENRAGHESYPHKVLVALDQDLNVDFGGLPDETISSRVRRVSDAHPEWGKNPAVWLAKLINAGCDCVQGNHGAKAQAGDVERAQNVIKVEDASGDLNAGPATTE